MVSPALYGLGKGLESLTGGLQFGLQRADKLAQIAQHQALQREQMQAQQNAQMMKAALEGKKFDALQGYRKEQLKQGDRRLGQGDRGLDLRGEGQAETKRHHLATEGLGNRRLTERAKREQDPFVQGKAHIQIAEQNIDNAYRKLARLNAGRDLRKANGAWGPKDEAAYQSEQARLAGDVERMEGIKIELTRRLFGDVDLGGGVIQPSRTEPIGR